MSRVDPGTVLAKDLLKAASTRFSSVLSLREYPAAYRGDALLKLDGDRRAVLLEMGAQVAYVLIGGRLDGTWRAVGVTYAFTDTGSALLMSPRRGGPGFGWLGAQSPQERQACAAALIDYLASAEREGLPLSALEVGFGLLDALREQLPLPGASWIPEPKHDFARTSEVHLHLFGPDCTWKSMLRVVQRADDVALRIPPATYGGEWIERELPSSAAVQGDIPALLRYVRQAIDGRSALRLRPFPVVRALDRIRTALESKLPALRPWRSEWSGDSPPAWPSGVVRSDKRNAPTAVALCESAQGVRLSAGDWVSTVAGDAALDAVLPDLIAALRGGSPRAAAPRDDSSPSAARNEQPQPRSSASESTQTLASLTPEKLERIRYRVIRPFDSAGQTIPAGSVLWFVGTEDLEDTERGVTATWSDYHFRLEPPGTAEVVLRTWSDSDVLRRLGEFLTPVDDRSE
ncbi:MAG: hypothetical protein HYZ53_28095 [Planctomycetes bacterium]|nr:hypothetical protein [Planctomycetota bacterium]